MLNEFSYAWDINKIAIAYKPSLIRKAASKKGHIKHSLVSLRGLPLWLRIKM